MRTKLYKIIVNIVSNFQSIITQFLNKCQRGCTSLIMSGFISSDHYRCVHYAITEACLHHHHHSNILHKIYHTPLFSIIYASMIYIYPEMQKYFHLSISLLKITFSSSIIIRIRSEFFGHIDHKRDFIVLLYMMRVTSSHFF